MPKNERRLFEKIEYSLQTCDENRVRRQTHASDCSWLKKIFITGCSNDALGCDVSNKRHEFEFSKTQIWVSTSSSVRFLDETPDLVEIYNEVESTEDNTDAGGSSHHTDYVRQCEPYQRLHHARSLENTSTTSRADANLHKRQTGDYQQVRTLDPRESVATDRTPHGGGDNVYESWATPSPIASRRTRSSNEQLTPATPAVPPSPWPLAGIEEAKLLWHFVENLSRRFDVVDPARHFRIEVPQRAISCPTLLNAILALSARHLSRLEEYDPLVSDTYHQKCLEHLIPMLDDSDAIWDENLLVSAIILRHLEEIDVPISGQSPTEESGKSHLLGTHVLMSAQEDAATTGGLRQAAFWVGLRQEIYMAFINQHSILPPLEHRNIDRSYSAAPDHAWSNRMVVLCADVLRYCYGEDDTSTATYYKLADSVSQWYERKPTSFDPLFYCKADEVNVLPELWFLREEISIGWQHYYISRILLGAHSPKIPRIGPRRAALLQEIDQDIKEKVLLLCGICQSNPAVSPNFTYAAMAITIAGDKFATRREQEALLEILEICDRKHALSTTHAANNLKLAWGWNDAY